MSEREKGREVLVIEIDLHLLNPERLDLYEVLNDLAMCEYNDELEDQVEKGLLGLGEKTVGRLYIKKEEKPDGQ